MKPRVEFETIAEPLAEPVYDVLLEGEPSESLRSRYPTLPVQTTGAQTALRRRISAPAQLDALLEKLCSLGLHLLAVHRLPGSADEAGTYEVRVAGEVGEPLMRYLKWPHHVVPRQTRIRVAATSNELHRFLRTCTECGASIEGVHRVGHLDVTQGRRPLILRLG